MGSPTTTYMEKSDPGHELSMKRHLASGIISRWLTGGVCSFFPAYPVSSEMTSADHFLKPKPVSSRTILPPILHPPLFLRQPIISARMRRDDQPSIQIPFMSPKTLSDYLALFIFRQLRLGGV